MTRVLVFNLANKFNLRRFARVEAVDLFRADSGVTLYDTVSERRDELAEIWPYWPKGMDSRPKAMADEILEQLRPGSSGEMLSVLYIVDTAAEVLPSRDGSNLPPAQQTVNLVDRIMKQNQNIHGMDINTYAICLSGHQNQTQREAVIDFFASGNSNIDGLFFIDSVMSQRSTVQSEASRLILDVLLKRGVDEDGARGFENQSDFAFIVKLGDPAPTVSIAMRHDFSEFVDGKRKAGSEQRDSEARESEEYKGLKELIETVDNSCRTIEEGTVEPIQLEVKRPDDKAPIYKTEDLLHEFDVQAEKYEEGLRLSAQEQIESSIKKQQTSAVESAEVEVELKRRLDNISVPTMQFRWSLLSVIRKELLPKLDSDVRTAQQTVTALRRDLSNFFSSPQNRETKAKTPIDGDMIEAELDLTQLQKFVSSDKYWEAHKRLLKAAKLLPSRGFANAIWLLSFFAIWAMSYAFLVGIAMEGSQTLLDYALWQHLTLTLPTTVTSANTVQFLLPVVAVVAFTIIVVSVKVIFSRLRKRVRFAHGRFLAAAAELETDFRSLAEKTLAYSKRARTLQFRKRFKIQITEALDEQKVQLLLNASKLMKLSDRERVSLNQAGLDKNKLRAEDFLKDESGTANWVSEYFGKSLNLKKAKLTIKVSDTVNEIEIESMHFIADTKVDFEMLRNWEL